MTDLLRSHKSFAIGRERYGRLFRTQSTLSPDLFQKERFCTALLVGDSHHRALDGYYTELLGRFDSCTHFGDKIPNLHKGYHEMARVFPGCKFVFMVRNIFDVAQSFEVRSERSKLCPESGWPTSRGYKQAVEEWNLSLNNTIAALDTGAIYVLEYEKLYTSDGLLKSLFSFLNATLNQSVTTFWAEASKMRIELEVKRANRLSSCQKNYIMRNSEFENCKILLSKFEKLL